MHLAPNAPGSDLYVLIVMMFSSQLQVDAYMHGTNAVLQLSQACHNDSPGIACLLTL